MDYLQTYKKIFSDQNFLPLIPYFHSKNWNLLTAEKKFKLLEAIEEISSKYFKRESVNLVLIDESGKASGSFIDGSNGHQIIIRKDTLNRSPYSVLSVYFHEKRHEHQVLATKGRINENPQLVKKWERNMYVNPTTKKSNYFSIDKDDKEKYYRYLYQPIEADAYDYGYNLAIEVGKLVQRYVGKDEEFADFMEDEIWSYKFYFESNIDYYVQRKKEIEEEIDQSLSENIRSR